MPNGDLCDDEEIYGELIHLDYDDYDDYDDDDYDEDIDYEDPISSELIDRFEFRLAICV